MEEPGIFFLLLAMAFVAEFIDSSLGMGYGTILSPVLIVMGFDPLVVVPSLLLSQAFGGFGAAIFHHRHENVIFTAKSRDTKIVFAITVLGVLATVLAVLIAVGISRTVLKTYIGVLVLAMGIILLSRAKFTFSWKRMIGVGIISSFNKGISGGGFGPVVTAGQIISGHEHKRAIGCTTLAEAPICIIGFAAYCLFKGVPEWRVFLPLILGAVFATPFGPLATKKLSEKSLRPILGVLIIILGVWTLIKTWL